MPPAPPHALSPAAPVALPGWQVLILCCVNYNEAVQGQILFPFIPFAVRRWGVAEDDVGFYVGLLISAFFLAQVLTVSLWGRLSDRYGRRPILLVGLGGTALTMLGFGVARSFEVALLARFLTGSLNGNVAIAKVYMGEITTSKTQAAGFAWLSFTWGMGIITAPALGGFLADPVTQFGPDSALGRIQLLRDYPYILPSLVSSCVSLVALLLGLCFLPETEAWRRSQLLQVRKAGRSSVKGAAAAATVAAASLATAGGRAGGTDEAEDEFAADDAEAEEGGLIVRGSSGVAPALATDMGAGVGDAAAVGRAHSLRAASVALGGLGSASKSAAHKADSLARVAAGGARLAPALAAAAASRRGALLPLDAGFRDILRHGVLMAAITNYMALSFVQIVFDELLPVIFATPRAQGGFGFESKDIGGLQVVQGATQVLFNWLLFPRLSARFGLIRLFRFAMVPWVLYLFFPALARLAPWPEAQWAAIAATLALKIVLTTSAFTSIILVINNATRGRALGAVNGFAQSGASLVRFLGPTFGGGLFSASLLYGEGLGAWRLHLPYLVVAMAAATTVLLSFRLPDWTETPEEDGEADGEVGKGEEREGEEEGGEGDGQGEGGGDGGVKGPVATKAARTADGGAGAAAADDDFGLDDDDDEDEDANGDSGGAAGSAPALWSERLALPRPQRGDLTTVSRA